VNAKKDKGHTPLYAAILYQRKEVVELLITAGADVNADEGTGWTPLHIAAGLNADLGGLSAEGHKEIVELLIGAGADVNAIDDFSRTPLDTAIRRKKPETADLLRKHGGKTAEELKAEGK
jgi:ankyrin repeat protein